MNFYKVVTTCFVLIAGISWFSTAAFAQSDFTKNEEQKDTTTYLDLQIKVLMEGVYDSNGEMRTALLSKNLLPNIHPFQAAPWNYSGLEGDGWTSSDYPHNAVDWVKVSFRATLAKNTEIAATAAVLLEDGTIFFPNQEVLQFMFSGIYIYIQHRNHMAVLSAQKVIPQNGQLVYDFSTQNSYTDGYGQKELEPGTWGMIAADGDQLSDIASDINGNDNAGWVPENGKFNVYNSFDYNMDGDVNGADRAIWSGNNGLFSSILK